MKIESNREMFPTFYSNVEILIYEAAYKKCGHLYLFIDKMEDVTIHILNVLAGW